MKKSVLLLLCDVLTAVVLMAGIWGYFYLMPHPMEGMTAGTVVSENGAELKTAKVLNGAAETDWHKKFADKFTDKIVSTDTVYSSPDIYIKLTRKSYDTNILDRTNGGIHQAYGTKVSYVLADIYVGDISCIKTAFAKDTYGSGYSEKLTDMSRHMRSVLSVNGDSYNNNFQQDNGTIIRNGKLYRNYATDAETCVLYKDGTMKIYDPGKLNGKQMVKEGAYQSWIFGPSLLDDKGKAKSYFLTRDYIKESHPRTAIGYYEPGHYCLLVVDGRQNSSRGMFLEEMAKLFEDLGCKAAYNLDGGHSSFMSREDKVVNRPYKPDKEIADGIFIVENQI